MRCPTPPVLALLAVLWMPIPAFAQDEPPSKAAQNLLWKGMDAVLAGCVGARPAPQQCPAGRVAKASRPQTMERSDGSGKITLQAVEYPGLSMSLRNRQVVGLEITQASWPVPHDLRVGTAAARVRQVLGAPTMEGPGPDGVQGLSYCEKENCVQFLVHVPTGTIRRVRWSFYYD